MLDLLCFGTSVSVTQDQTQIPPDWSRGGGNHCSLRLHCSNIIWNHKNINHIQ